MSISSKVLASLMLLWSLWAVAQDAPRSANFRFEMQFSESGLFNCWSPTNKVGLGINSGLPYGMKRPAGLSNAELSQGLTVEIETYPGKGRNHIDRLWGLATFTDGDQQVSVALNNGKTAHFARFGPTPDWPFKAKKDSQLFFTFRLDEGPTYRCKAVYQPDQ